MLELNKNNLYDFVEEVEQFLQQNNLGYAKIGNYVLNNEDRMIIPKCIELRTLVNAVRNVNHIAKYQRTNGDLVDLKGFSGEHAFSRFMYELQAKNRTAKVQVILPAMAEMILNKTKQDIDVTDLRNNKSFTFDVKSQFKENKFPFITINQGSFKRMKQQSQFFIAALVHCSDQSNIDTYTNVDFWLVNNQWFEEKSFKVDESWKSNFTPYHKLPLSYFANTLDNPITSKE